MNVRFRCCVLELRYEVEYTGAYLRPHLDEIQVKNFSRRFEGFDDLNFSCLGIFYGSILLNYL